MRQTERHAGGLRAALAIARRDLVEFVRDRRTLFITLLLPMVTYPILALSTALGLRTASSEIEAQRAPTKIVVTVSGPDAIALVDRIGFVGKKTPGSGREGWPSAIELAAVTAADARGRLDQGVADLWLEAPRGCVAALDADATVAIPVHLPPGRPPNRRVRDQFDAVIHFDTTRAVEPLECNAEWEKGEIPETYPVGL